MTRKKYFLKRVRRLNHNKTPSILAISEIRRAEARPSSPQTEALSNSRKRSCGRRSPVGLSSCITTPEPLTDHAEVPVSGWTWDVLVLHVNVFNVETESQKSDRKRNEQEKQPVSGPVQHHAKKRHFFSEGKASRQATGR